MMTQAENIVNNENGHTQPAEAAVGPGPQDGHEDRYAQVDALLLRKSEDRAPYQVDHRSSRLRDMSFASTLWTRTEAATVLDYWTFQIGDHSQFI